MSEFDKNSYLKDLPDPDDAWLRSLAEFDAAASGFGGSGRDADSVADAMDDASADAHDDGDAGESEAVQSDDKHDSSMDAAYGRSDNTTAGGTGEKAGKTMSSEQANDKADNEAKQTREDATASAVEDNFDNQADGTNGDAAREATGQAEHRDSNNGADTSETAGKGEGGADTLTPLGQAKKEAAEYLEALQRERAEFVNFRNRSKKDQATFRQHGIIDVLTALLPALDDIDRIREHSEMDDSFAAVANKIDKTFEKFGVEKFGEKGETFDPTKHEAVLHKPDAEATEEIVDTVVEAGYRIGDRVIRAARVVVASPQV